ncbi:MAG: hypothetical protein IPM96_14140 [Ignavibacteria bacterium]|nr:hypothetical protein [Ignavibacteria bacterium]
MIENDTATVPKHCTAVDKHCAAVDQHGAAVGKHGAAVGKQVAAVDKCGEIFTLKLKTANIDCFMIIFRKENSADDHCCSLRFRRCANSA